MPLPSNLPVQGSKPANVSQTVKAWGAQLAERAKGEAEKQLKVGRHDPALKDATDLDDPNGTHAAANPGYGDDVLADANKRGGRVDFHRDADFLVQLEACDASIQRNSLDASAWRDKRFDPPSHAIPVTPEQLAQLQGQMHEKAQRDFAGGFPPRQRLKHPESGQEGVLRSMNGGWHFFPTSGTQRHAFSSATGTEDSQTLEFFDDELKRQRDQQRRERQKTTQSTNPTSTTSLDRSFLEELNACDAVISRYANFTPGEDGRLDPVSEMVALNAQRARANPSGVDVSEVEDFERLPPHTRSRVALSAADWLTSTQGPRSFARFDPESESFFANPRKGKDVDHGLYGRIADDANRSLESTADVAGTAVRPPEGHDAVHARRLASRAESIRREADEALETARRLNPHAGYAADGVDRYETWSRHHDRILKALDESPGLSHREVADALGMNHADVASILADLHEQGDVVSQGNRFFIPDVGDLHSDATHAGPAALPTNELKQAFPDRHAEAPPNFGHVVERLARVTRDAHELAWKMHRHETAREQRHAASLESIDFVPGCYSRNLRVLDAIAKGRYRASREVINRAADDALADLGGTFRHGDVIGDAWRHVINDARNDALSSGANSMHYRYGVRTITLQDISRHTTMTDVPDSEGEIDGKKAAKKMESGEPATLDPDKHFLDQIAGFERYSDNPHARRDAQHHGNGGAYPGADKRGPSLFPPKQYPIGDPRRMAEDAAFAKKRAQGRERIDGTSDKHFFDQLESIDRAIAAL